MDLLPVLEKKSAGNDTFSLLFSIMNVRTNTAAGRPGYSTAAADYY
jgi:hypothetical protein